MVTYTSPRDQSTESSRQRNRERRSGRFALLDFDKHLLGAFVSCKINSRAYSISEKVQAEPRIHACEAAVDNDTLSGLEGALLTVARFHDGVFHARMMTIGH